MSRGLRLGLCVSPLGAACAGCRGWQSALDPQGPQAVHLRHLILLCASVGAVVWVLVMGTTFIKEWYFFYKARGEPKK